jgi:ornithine cyclodeaminase/alanine dehydrogenase-like protein (mu-crystallin family)
VSGDAAAPIHDDSQTLILGRRDVTALMDRTAWLEAAELAFRALGEGRADLPAPMAIEGVDGAFHAKGGGLRLDRLFVALKLNGNFPGNAGRYGLPTIQGAVLLCDGETGSLLAIVESIELTLRRTAAASALAARLLARPDAGTLLVCGCGRQGGAHLEALAAVLPLARCLAWDMDAACARRFAARFDGGEGMRVEPVDDLAGAARQADVIAACTSATIAYLDATMVSPGAFIAAVGADAPAKNEIAAALVARAVVIADSRSQCAAMGDLHHALVERTVDLEHVRAELHEVLLGAKPGRTAEDQIILFDSTGTAVQDVAACIRIHESACRSGNFLSIALGEA